MKLSDTKNTQATLFFEIAVYKQKLLIRDGVIAILLLLYFYYYNTDNYQINYNLTFSSNQLTLVDWLSPNYKSHVEVFIVWTGDLARLYLP